MEKTQLRAEGQEKQIPNNNVMKHPSYYLSRELLHKELSLSYITRELLHKELSLPYIT